MMTGKHPTKRKKKRGSYQKTKFAFVYADGHQMKDYNKYPTLQGAQRYAKNNNKTQRGRWRIVKVIPISKYNPNKRIK